MRRAFLVLTLLSSGCDLLPRDVDATSQRIAAERTARIGIAEPIGEEGGRFLAALARDTGVRLNRRTDSLEPLLISLEQGDLDLVVGRFAHDSGWRTRVALTPPLDGTKDGDRALAVHAAARNGEHRWVMRLERLARANAR